MSEKEKIKKRIEFLKTEIVMEGYLDGWTLAGLKKELKTLEEKLTRI